ncbi:hypothetical protein D3OALGB2SA_1062 [Olavius algarvensis associated proteobacterium Delta 3]|nr:hypothetical protein D3OALGB2SA_1062 [Olavius algarvensis associated proteobacterium Delta 3]
MSLSLKLITVAILLLPLLSGCGSQESVASLAKIGWQSYDAGLRQAAESDKKIFLYFRADW